MIIRYIQEFVAITDFLITHNEKVSKGFVIVDKSIILAMLQKNNYDAAMNKLKIWKALHWIDTEDRRVTKRVYDKESKTYKPFVKIDLKVQGTLKTLIK